ncbi:ABC transporter ATP-binding protein [Youngiibacter multivorans]|uniref:ABC-type dipeptide/oligopeptide/nickel transport system ATPase component n=1 Tax=Youngiibacter multivorans TaxID=937251 RepID=A0ABS4G6H4_9CLOT|nr:ABC transporter ATP-binding protein [Youngiibacter multivorans]MBP1920124.1 ABC-type dipeptide/oligopeptide/nickel transport system ATPase component [Youngiibacter multivorans]
MNKERLLEINNLSISFKTDDGDIPTIKNVSMHINEGEIITVVGESGSGKSVTMRSIMRLIATPPAIYTGGEILYKGKDLLKVSEEEIRKLRGSEISMIFQDPMTALNPVFTIGEQMENIYIYQGQKSTRSKLPRSKKVMKKEARARSIELLAKMSLPNPEGILGMYPFELSGGMKQRVIIAMALIKTPRLLLADEPGTSLDVTVQSSINEELKRLVLEEKISMIFITHNLGVAKQLGERTYVMKLGEVVEEGESDEVFLNPREEYTKSLMNALPRIV